MLGGFSRVLLLLEIGSILVGVLWLATVRDLLKPAPEPGASRVSILGVLRNLLSQPAILLLCLIYALFNGGWMGSSGAYPMLAQKARNMSALATNNVVSVACWLYTLGAFLIPGASDRVGYRRPFYSFFILIAGIGMFLTFLLPPPAVWLWAIVWGFAAGAVPILFAMPFEMEEVGPAYGGTAIGLIFTGGSIGGFIFPLIVAKISQSFSPLQAMTWIGVLCGLFAYVSTGLLIWTIRETGPKSHKA
jgi:nitrate/nitrite transporter NarK